MLVAIGLVIETALGPKPKQNLSPPSPGTRPHRSGIRAPGHSAPSPSAAAALIGPIQIIQGSQLVNGVYLGFPHTTQGAVSAAEEFMAQIGSTLDPDRASAVLRLTADPSYPSGPQDFAAGTISEPKDLGLPATGQLPSSASAILDPVEYQVRDVTADQVHRPLLADDVPDSSRVSAPRPVSVSTAAVALDRDHWKILQPAKGATYSDLSAVPGSPQAASLGWQEMTP